MRKAISKYKNNRVVKDYFAIVGSNIALRPLLLLKGFIVAKFLGPTEYGILKSVELVQMLNKFGNAGFKQVASREIGHARGVGDSERENIIRNTNYSAELILSVLLFLAGVVSSFFFQNTKISILILIASVGLLAMKIESIYICEIGIQKKFIALSKVTFYTGLATTIMVMALVPFIKIYAILIVNIIVSVFGIWLYHKNVEFNYKFEINKKELKEALRIGIPFSIATLTYGLYKYSERILIIKFLDTTSLGYFGFGTMVLDQFMILFTASIKVRTQDLFENIGAKKFKIVNRIVIRETFILVLGSIVVIPIVWYALDIFVPWLLPQWTDGIIVAKYLMFTLPFLVIANYTAAVTSSRLINKINHFTYYRLVSAIILIGGTLILYYLNELTLLRYTILNIIGYAYYNLSQVYVYYKHFYLKYVK